MMRAKRSREDVTSFSNGKKHDFRLFKESGVRLTKERSGITDSGYTGIKITEQHEAA
jgi:hypothetical protein